MTLRQTLLGTSALIAAGILAQSGAHTASIRPASTITIEIGGYRYLFNSYREQTR